MLLDLFRKLLEDESKQELHPATVDKVFSTKYTGNEGCNIKEDCV